MAKEDKQTLRFPEGVMHSLRGSGGFFDAEVPTATKKEELPDQNEIGPEAFFLPPKPLTFEEKIEPVVEDVSALKQTIATLELALSDLKNQHSKQVGDLLAEHTQQLADKEIEYAHKFADKTAEYENSLANAYDEFRKLLLWNVERTSGKKSIVVGSDAEDALRRAKAAVPETDVEKIIGVRSLNERVIV